MEFGILGPVEIRAGGQVLDAGHARRRAVLAVLLLNFGHVVPVEALIDRVWGEEPPASVRNTLYGYVARLRSVIVEASDPRVTLARRPGGYLLQAEDGQLDLCLFRRLTAEAAACPDGTRGAALLRQALGLWRGPALAGVRSPWLDAMRDTLEADRLAALADLSDIRLRHGEHGALVGELTERAVARPGDERLIAQLMLALYRSGRQADALRWFDRTRHHLASELGIDPGSSLRALHEQILRADPALNAAGSVSVRPEPGGAVAVPRQLPAVAGHFTGRVRELDLITGVSGPPRQAEVPGQADTPGGTVVISAIDGMAGIGKTALAVHAAHRLAREFPGGQLFIDLHGHTQGYPPREPGEALGSLLRGLGVAPRQVPDQPEERAALYRQRLAGTRTLIVLDNALDEAQVRPLLPGEPGCLVLVTSRRRLKGLHDAHVVALDVLPEADAITLLRTVTAPAHAAAADPDLAEIAGLCGRLPLALRIAGALLRHRPAWTPGYLAGLLRDEQQRLATLADGDHDLSGVFDLSYAVLGERQRLLFRRLALVPGPEFDAPAAAALLDGDPAAAAGLLEDLVDHNLIIEHVPGRYRLHDLIRVHARMLADGDPQADRDGALDRLLGYYAHTAQSASALVAQWPRPAPDGHAPACAPALTGAEKARAWLRTERENLQAAWDRASTLALDEHAVALAAGLAEILRTDGSLARALALHQSAASAAERRGWPAARATALTDLANVRVLTGDLAGAADAAAQALGIFRAAGNRVAQASALIALGRVRVLDGDLAGVADAAAQALGIFRAAGHRLGEAAALTDLGHQRLLSGDLAAAAAAEIQALGIFRAAGNRLGEAAALTDLARVRFWEGDLAGAADAATRVLEIYRAAGNRLGEAAALTELARVRVSTGDLAGASAAEIQALEIYRETGNRNGEAIALAELAGVRLAAGDLPSATDAVARALEIFRAIGSRNGEAWALNRHAAVVAATGDRPRALTLYRQALAMNRELSKPDDEAVALEGIGECRLAAGQAETSATCLHQALEIYQRLGMKTDIERVRTRLQTLHLRLPGSVALAARS